MKTFFKCINNGVIAIVEGPTYEAIEKWCQLPDDEKARTLYPKPIFTFVAEDRLSNFPHVTGSTKLMDELLHDHVVVKREFYVPFSNHRERNGDTYELRFRTSLLEAINAFQLGVCTF